MNLKLKALRKTQDLTQAQLAEKVGVTPRVLSAWERGETALPLEDACTIADVLECTLDELAGREWVDAARDAEERELVECYREAPKASRGLMMHAARVGRAGGQALNEGHSHAEGVA